MQQHRDSVADSLHNHVALGYSLAQEGGVCAVKGTDLLRGY